MERGEERVWGISFKPFAAGFQFLTMECVSGLCSDGFRDKWAKESAFYKCLQVMHRKNVDGTSMDIF